MFDVCGNSVCGPARHNNEDYYAYRNAPDHAVLAIADGLGGCPYGEVASRIAVEASMEFLDGALADISGVDDLSFELDKAFNKANIEILRNCAENPDYIGMCRFCCKRSTDHCSLRRLQGISCKERRHTPADGRPQSDRFPAEIREDIGGGGTDARRQIEPRELSWREQVYQT